MESLRRAREVSLGAGERGLGCLVRGWFAWRSSDEALLRLVVGGVVFGVALKDWLSAGRCLTGRSRPLDCVPCGMESSQAAAAVDHSDKRAFVARANSSAARAANSLLRLWPADLVERPERCTPLIDIVLVLALALFLLIMIRRRCTPLISLVVVLVLLRLAVLPDRDLDALRCEDPAERRGLDDAGELLGGVDLEGLGVGPGEDGALAAVEAGAAGGVADVDEVHLESGGGG